MTYCLTVASLGLVSPGAATDGVAHIFPGKTDDLFCSSLYHCHFLWFQSGVTPLEGVTPHFFYLFDLACPLFFVNSATNNLFGCHPLEGVTPCGPPLVTPLIVSIAIPIPTRFPWEREFVFPMQTFNHDLLTHCHGRRDSVNVNDVVSYSLLSVGCSSV